MLGIYPLRNETLHYDWGSVTAIAEFLGTRPGREPSAEVWLGAHPKAPSRVFVDGAWTALDQLLRSRPEGWLGTPSDDDTSGVLPFLLKILAAAKPLSIQAHPNREQARAGFAREEASGKHRDDPTRNYRDPHAKPEIIYAVTPFTVLCGFRPAAEPAELAERFGLTRLLPEAAELRATGDYGAFFSAVLRLDASRLREILDVALDHPPDLPESHWIRNMTEEFGEDRGALAPLFLNLRSLAPGEAMYTGPGILHAYLDGLGIELMASSDNVLRGGCTPKHVDVPELLQIVRFEEHAPHMVQAERPQTGVEIFAVPELELARLAISEGSPFDRVPDDRLGPQILLCAEGRGSLIPPAGDPLPFCRGDSFIVPAEVERYGIRGKGVFFRARVGR